VLDAMTVDAFAAAVGAAFVIGDADRLELVLLEARTIAPGAPASAPDGTRNPFRLVFRGPHEPVLPQRMYRLEHDPIGPLEIFLVPITRDAESVNYEAIFA
jgi:hypothetical protein